MAKLDHLEFWRQVVFVALCYPSTLGSFGVFPPIYPQPPDTFFTVSLYPMIPVIMILVIAL